MLKNLEEIASLLGKNKDYQVLKRFEQVEQYNSSYEEDKLIEQAIMNSLIESESKNVDEDLTSILKENAESCLVSEDTKHHAKAEINKFNQALKRGEYVERSQSLDIIVNDLMRPLIKDWLDNNLPKIVENIVSEEIKKIIPKK